MKSKKWYESKVIWLNIAAFILSIIALVNDGLLTSLGIESKEKVLAIIGTITTILNIVLRWGTVAPITTQPSGTRQI